MPSSQLFGNKFVPPAFSEPPRANFDSIVFSMITVFISVTGDGWNDVWVDVHRVSGGPTVPAFFVSLIVIANYMLLSLMVALLLGSFDQTRVTTGATLGITTGVTESPPGGATPRSRDERGNPSSPASPRREGSPGSPASPYQLPSRLQQLPPALVAFLDARRDHALLLLGPEHPVRRVATAVITSRCHLCARLPSGGDTPGLVASFDAGCVISFENGIILLILGSSLSMAFDSCDLYPNSDLSATLDQARCIPLSTVKYRCIPLPTVACRCMPLHTFAHLQRPSSTVTQRYMPLRPVTHRAPPRDQIELI